MRLSIYFVNQLIMKKNILLATSILLLCFPLWIKSQTITIDSTFTSDGEIFPFSQLDSIYGVSLSGHITLNSDSSLVRVILFDENYDEYMVYEAYPLIVTSTDFDISNASDETTYLDEVFPYSLVIQMTDAEFELDDIIISMETLDNAEYIIDSLKIAVENVKIDNINAYNDENNVLWGAGETDIGLMKYADKKENIWRQI